MTLLLFEDDLMWSSRIRVAAQELGIVTIVVRNLETIPQGDVAIFNLSHRSLQPDAVRARLKESNTPCIAHAGHKEKPKLDEARRLGFDRIATNGEVSRRLLQLLLDVAPENEQLIAARRRID